MIGDALVGSSDSSGAIWVLSLGKEERRGEGDEEKGRSERIEKTGEIERDEERSFRSRGTHSRAREVLISVSWVDPDFASAVSVSEFLRREKQSSFRVRYENQVD